MHDPRAEDESVDGLDAAALADPVGRLLGLPHAGIRDWLVTPLGVGVGNPVSLGVYRVAGTVEGGSTSWSLVLKVVQSPANVGLSDMGEGPDQSHWNYWRREPLLLDSNVLVDLPVGFGAPRLYGWSERSGNIVWLWLEDLTDARSEWTSAQFEHASFQIGRFNGLYLVRNELPDYPWLSRRSARQMIGLAQRFLPVVEDRVPGVRRHPVAKFIWEAASVLSALESMPQTFCHLDAGPYNLMTRPSLGSGERIIAIDWALAGISPVGADLSQLVINPDSSGGFALLDNEPTLFERYCDGLHDTGCNVDPDLVRFGYLAFMVSRLSSFFVTFLWRDLEGGKTPAIEDTALPALAPYVKQVQGMVPSRI